MKKLVFLIAILIANFMSAQTGFNYKALITDGGNALANQAITIKFTVLQNGTTSVYQETQSATTDANGIVAVNMGEGTVVSGTFANIDWQQSQLLKVEIDTGSGYQDFGTSTLEYVPLAKLADKVATVDNIQGIPIANGTPANGQIIKYNGTNFVYADDDVSGGGSADGVVNSAAVTGTNTKTLTLGRSNGLSNITATFTDNVNDADHSTTNEIQDISLTNNNLSITNGSTVDLSNIDNNTWSRTGNAGTNNNNFIGTTDAKDLNIRTNNTLHVRITQKGQIETLNTGGSVFIGEGAGANDDGTNNGNTAVGTNALNRATSSTSNNAFGRGALLFNTDGQDNTAFGSATLSGNRTGNYNVAVGNGAGFENTTGSSNVFIGFQSGYHETGSNKLYIENSSSSNPLIGGDFSTDEVTINGSIAIKDGTQGANKVLTSDANGKASWQTPATSTGLWSSNGNNIYRNTGNVGIGTNTPGAPLEIKSDATPSLIIGSYSPNYNVRPGIQFKHNTSQYISGDDGSDEIFGFYAKWANNRTHDARLRVYGKASSSWGKYVQITHDGTDGIISSDTGDIKLAPDGNVAVDKKIVATGSGNNDLKAFAYGTIDYDGTKLSGTDNFHIDHGAGTGIYKITFTGQNYDYQHFTTIVSVKSVYWPNFIFSYANNYKLVVKIFNKDGSTLENEKFSFVTYKN